ncbi:N-acetyltransferase [Sphingorhabdus sp. Alg239-R122]|uniref:GNAT family N-acetyltransferase n=1 Tax=Sphingorhabdus sp. Alg239-R122 TaxID=2305989 RepID=UPI0019676BDB|nr:N-acetyltransferase [Sphingorhabdus sp. Alg239-R122]
MDICIRPEIPDDYAAIHDVTKRAFAPTPYSDGDESDLIDRLRKAEALAISLVAEKDARIAGHIAFSPAYADDRSQGWYALGPVAVAPELQRQNIGSALINKGIDLLRERNAAGCILVGNPDYYTRFGFLPFPSLAPREQPAEYFMILPLETKQPQATVQFHALFQGV